MEEDSVASASTKKTPKKVYHPFGTPSHSSHAYSEFSHLDMGSKSLAVGLAATKEFVSDGEVEEQPKRRRTASRSGSRPKPAATTKGKKKGTDGDSEGKGGDEEKDEQENEDLQPCTKIPCQQVIRAIAELQFKNETERLDLEDRLEQLVIDLQAAQQEVIASDSRLSKLTEIGDQLEMSLTQFMSKVEGLEKKNASLVDERAEINSKMMLLQVERQKYNRRLEKAQKSLADARWRKKKQAQAEDAENGLSFPVSEIADRKIVRKDDASVKADLDVASTSYNALAREQVVDLLERAPTLKTLPPALQEDFMVTSSATFDKYAQKHYRQAIGHSLDSWEALQSTTLACDVRRHPKYNGPSTDGTVGSLSSPGSLHQQSTSSLTVASRQNTAASASYNSVSGAHAAAQRVGKVLSKQVQQQQQLSTEHQHRQELVTSMHKLVNLVQSRPQQAVGSGFSVSSSTASAFFQNPDQLRPPRPSSPSSRPNTSQGAPDSGSVGSGSVSLNNNNNNNNSQLLSSASVASLSALDRRKNYKPNFSRKNKAHSGTVSGGHSASTGNLSIRLTPLTLPGSAGGSLSLPLQQLGGQNLLSTLHSEYEEKLEQDGIFLPMSALAHDQLDAQSTGFTQGQQSSSATGFYSNIGPVDHKPNIDGVFYRSTAQTHWGRSHRIGEVRSTPMQTIPHTVVHPAGSTVGHGTEVKGGGSQLKPPKKSYKTITGLTVVDMRQLPRLHSRTLTIEHPGMASFESAQAMWGGGATAAGADAHGSSRTAS